ncbi:MAG: hypothetical protein OEY14_01295 [Myxococcales bacterium]|nr:hypothetical protein [Myxococcales bacterium]
MMRAIWGMMLMSNALYVIVLGVITPIASAPPLSTVLVLAVAAAMQALASLFVPGLILRKKLHEMSFEIREEVVAGDPSLFREPAPSRHVFADPAELLATAYRQAMGPLVLRLGFGEAVCVTGLVVGLLGGRPICYLFIVLGVAVIAWAFPTQARIVAPFERHFGAVFEPSSS